MTRVRQRQLDALERRFREQVHFVTSALAAQARAEWPKAEFGQLWLVVRDRLRPLLQEACEIAASLSVLGERP
jgi:hypothetical protein